MLSDGAGELRGVLNFLGARDGETDITECLNAASFESLAKGRGAGEEDRGSYFCKGVQGDWREHFDDEIHAAFCARSNAGAQLAALGYDEDGGA